MLGLSWLFWIIVWAMLWTGISSVNLNNGNGIWESNNPAPGQSPGPPIIFTGIKEKSKYFLQKKKAQNANKTQKISLKNKNSSKIRFRIKQNFTIENSSETEMNALKSEFYNFSEPQNFLLKNKTTLSPRILYRNTKIVLGKKEKTNNYNKDYFETKHLHSTALNKNKNNNNGNNVEKFYGSISEYLSSNIQKLEKNKLKEKQNNNDNKYKSSMEERATESSIKDSATDSSTEEKTTERFIEEKETGNSVQESADDLVITSNKICIYLNELLLAEKYPVFEDFLTSEDANFNIKEDENVKNTDKFYQDENIERTFSQDEKLKRKEIKTEELSARNLTIELRDARNNSVQEIIPGHLYTGKLSEVTLLYIGNQVAVAFLYIGN